MKVIHNATGNTSSYDLYNSEPFIRLMKEVFGVDPTDQELLPGCCGVIIKVGDPGDTPTAKFYAGNSTTLSQILATEKEQQS